MHRAQAWLAVVGLGVFSVAPVWGQDAPPHTPPETVIDMTEVQRLRDEVARLTMLAEQFSDLEARLAASERRVEALLRDNADLRNRLAAAMRRLGVGEPRGEAPATTEPHAPIPADPLASPDSMLRELRRLYMLEFGSEIPEDPEVRSRRQAMIDQWSRRMAREMRGRPTWLVRITDLVEREGGRFEAKITMLDEATGLPFGEPFISETPRSFALRIRDGGFDRWRLTVAFEATPRLNRERMQPGVFDTPRLIGPWAEFHYTVTWRQLVGVRPEPDATALPVPETPSTGRER
ncbi:MAG: hypothetical protein KF866_00985 [Phycisphaeraceae bacterium]|nr:hypothetical protein [Phycisphaeraceae bacterium]MCW5755082.1 hypothetical protein [Phycisphaeraceae bacterium]